jgi:nicotinamidase-related amidase
MLSQTPHNHGVVLSKLPNIMPNATSKQALILVDIQNDYFPGGSFELVGMEAAAQKAQMMLKGFRDRQAPIFHIQHLSTHPGATFFLPGTEGAEINPIVAPNPDEAVITKHFPSSFRETPLLEKLQAAGVESVVICGAMSHMCIDATVRSAFDLGLSCVVIADACATRDLEYDGNVVAAAEVQCAFMAALTMFYAQVIAADTFEWAI